MLTLFFIYNYYLNFLDVDCCVQNEKYKICLKILSVKVLVLN